MSLYMLHGLQYNESTLACFASPPRTFAGGIFINLCPFQNELAMILRNILIYYQNDASMIVMWTGEPFFVGQRSVM